MEKTAPPVKSPALHPRPGLACLSAAESGYLEFRELAPDPSDANCCGPAAIGSRRGGSLLLQALPSVT